MAVLGAVSAGTSLLGGIFGAKSAKSAAQLQAEAAAAAGKKVEDTVASTNPDVLKAAHDAGQDVVASAATGSADVNRVAGEGTAGVTAAVTGANKLLDPYSEAGGVAAGVLKAGIAPGGDFNKTPTLADLQIDPGYAFRQKQAEQALERSAAAHGTIDSGGYLKDLTDYSQGAASQEYQNAFSRFETSTQNRFANVSGVAGQGQTAATRQGTNLVGAGEFNAGLTTGASKFGAGMNLDASKFAGTADINATDLTTGRTIQGANTAADYSVSGANAKAAGDVAATKSIWGGITGAATDALGTFMTLKRPNYIDPYSPASGGLPPGPRWQGPRAPMNYFQP